MFQGGSDVVVSHGDRLAIPRHLIIVHGMCTHRLHVVVSVQLNSLLFWVIPYRPKNGGGQLNLLTVEDLFTKVDGSDFDSERLEFPDNKL